MAKVRDVAEVVKAILEKYPATRETDHLLYAYVLNHYGLSKMTPYWVLVQKIQDKAIPSIETVGRARRKAQELYPELQASKPVHEARINETAQYIDFSKDGSI